jgi:hypothetical protein
VLPLPVAQRRIPRRLLSLQPGSPPIKRAQRSTCFTYVRATQQYQQHDDGVPGARSIMRSAEQLDDRTNARQQHDS